MKILAIDTSTRFMCIGVSDGKAIYEYRLEAERKLSKLLVPSIKRVLGAADTDVSGIGYFACGIGPGSFTGLRIGVSAIKGLSFALKKPVAGIPALDILAKGVRRDSDCIVPVIDAKRGLVYCALYSNKNNLLKRLSKYMLLSVDDLLKNVKNYSIFLGDALILYKEKINRNVKGALILEKDYWYPKAHNIIELAIDKIKAGRLNTSSDIKPIYLYPKECQVKCATTGPHGQK
ncbi:MAG: tRNA (adenosine(37)-N6)-threonylcarbamoyltransferase complex dimerization subunit type 1 TsaB [Candidatus Omnitrophota bacterium]